MMRYIETGDAPDAVGPYSQGTVRGDTVAVAGQIGLTPGGELRDGVAAQARQALENVAAILAAAGADWGDVMKVRLYLTDIDDYDTVNDVYEDVVPAPYPARVVVGVADLPASAAVEVEATAVRD